MSRDTHLCNKIVKKVKKVITIKVGIISVYEDGGAMIKMRQCRGFWGR